MKNTKKGLNMSTISKPQEAIVVTKGISKKEADTCSCQLLLL